ncbi:MAG: 1-acyl-sn-glycerol-3-phosphate acyltransferase [Bacteroidetes bacterium]|nr:1-acyl-sn-glycerol-3-phosphate acyltransferase [Bacteroidota bacterium]
MPFRFINPVNIILSVWVTFVVPVFYKKIRGRNIKYITGKNPVIIAMNHPNAFMDPTLINMLTFPENLKYLARGDSFKPGIISWLLEQIGIVPIYRIQDGGKEGLKKNEETYTRVNAFLKRNKKVIVFAEGLCIQEKRLRPLKKGVARMVFGAYEAINNKSLTVVPVGVNYSNPSKIGSTLFYNIGEPILVSNFEEKFKENPARCYNEFLTLLEIKMKELIIHINDKKNDALYNQTEQLCLLNELNKNKFDINNLHHQVLISQKIASKINLSSAVNANALEAFSKKINTYFEIIEANNLKESSVTFCKNKWQVWLKSFLLIISLPLCLLGIAVNYIPFKIADFLAKKVPKDIIEFYASLFIAFAMLFFLIFYLSYFFIIKIITSSIFIAMIACIIFGLSAYFFAIYKQLFAKTKSDLKLLFNTSLRLQLEKRKNELISDFNRL